MRRFFLAIVNFFILQCQNVNNSASPKTNQALLVCGMRSRIHISYSCTHSQTERRGGMICRNKHWSVTYRSSVIEICYSDAKLPLWVRKTTIFISLLRENVEYSLYVAYWE